MISINSQFSSGNIELVGDIEARPIALKIKADNQSEFRQWFHFKVNNALNQSLSFTIVDADKTAYPDGWVDYQVCASYDGQSWFRIPTEYAEGELRFQMDFEESSAYFAYFAPYSYERHLDLIHDAAQHEWVTHQVLGETLDGREMNLLSVGDAAAPIQAWVIARQHPGESMAEWFMEGFIGRLLDHDDAVARKLLQQVRFHLVPNMNPDGTERGHLRTNAKGINLNREWNRAQLDNSPEVLLVQQQMQQTGVDLFLDVHGDEGLPYNFVAGSEGVPRFDKTMAQWEQDFVAAFKATTPEFQDEYGYPKDAPGQADLSIASSWVAETFGCLALTLEMPFKDNANLPDPLTGWSSDRSALLGQAVLQPILAHVEKHLINQ